MCDEVQELISQDERIVEFNRQRLNRYQEESDVTYDDNMHIMVYDIIYCSHAYSFYSDMDIVKTSTKDRIKRAGERNKRDAIERELEDLNEQKKNAEEQIQEIKVEIESPIMHKKYGAGIVNSTDEGHIVVAYGDDLKTFQFPGAFEMGFLRIDDEEIMSTFARNAESARLIKELDGKIKILEGYLMKMN